MQYVVYFAVRFYGNGNSSKFSRPVKTDLDTLREGYRFIRTEEDDKDPSWEQRLVKRYYDKLFKEYCISDMTKYKSGKIGLRWRTEKEVISGKGQFICGNKNCGESDNLGGYEVNFSYFEAGESKQALVKLVACERCADMLHYRKRKEKEQIGRMDERELEKEVKHDRKRKREQYGKDGRDNEDNGSEYQNRKGTSRPSTTDRKKMGHEKDDFDEYLVGMFP
ncbi:hypothetical protein SAY86_010664 [Trapa natans]|uniref:Protein FRA10AC1 n=1 Tax=Trapa natans TaxID=22666 RepID=A0AAN7LWN8_TRANT|nr:hypothetical protein SAY86_010664 [Trapa natans]